MHNDLIPTAEVADLLGVDRSTISRWVAFGHLTPAIRTSRRGAMLFNRAEVKAFAKTDRAIAARTRPSKASA